MSCWAVLIVASMSLVSTSAQSCGTHCNLTFVQFPPISGCVCWSGHPYEQCCADGQGSLCADNASSMPLCSSAKGRQICPGNTGGSASCTRLPQMPVEKLTHTSSEDCQPEGQPCSFTSSCCSGLTPQHPGPGGQCFCEKPQDLYSASLRCSLNGDFDPIANQCQCDPQWQGSQCEKLNLLPAEGAAGLQTSGQLGVFSSWGGSVRQVPCAVLLPCAVLCCFDASLGADAGGALILGHVLMLLVL